jgi:hypothetical protein
MLVVKNLDLDQGQDQGEAAYYPHWVALEYSDPWVAFASSRAWMEQPASGLAEMVDVYGPHRLYLAYPQHEGHHLVDLAFSGPATRPAVS